MLYVGMIPINVVNNKKMFRYEWYSNIISYLNAESYKLSFANKLERVKEAHQSQASTDRNDCLIWKILIFQIF